MDHTEDDPVNTFKNHFDGRLDLGTNVQYTVDGGGESDQPEVLSIECMVETRTFLATVATEEIKRSGNLEAMAARLALQCNRMLTMPGRTSP